MRYLGIDIGSSFIKVILFDIYDQKAIFHYTLPSVERLNSDSIHKFELDANKIVNKVKEIINDALEKSENIDGILICTQMHGFVFDNKTNNQRYISWQDSRCANLMPKNNISYLEFLKRNISKVEMEKCGVYIKPSLGMCNLYTMLESEEKLHKSGELFTMGSYIIYKLTGNNICHISNAAALGLVDIKNKTWDEKIIKKVGLENIELPQIAVTDTQVCGYYKLKGKNIKIYPDFGDQQTAVLGVMPTNNDVIINIATASQIAVISEDFNPGEYEVRPYFENKFINTISNMPGGRNLAVLTDFVREIILKFEHRDVSTKEVWDVISNECNYDAKELYMNMDFYDTPSNTKGGSISNIRSYNLTVETLFSAAFKEMAQTYCNNTITLVGKDNYQGKIVFLGGVSWKNPMLMRYISDYMCRQYVLSSIPDEVFLGMFRIALVCAGVCSNLTDRQELTLKL